MTVFWLLILWSLWYSCSNDDELVHGLLWWDFEPWLLISIFCAHTRMSWMSFDSEIRIDHADFCTMVERSFAYICYFMLNLEDHGDVGPHGWLLDTYEKMLFWYENLSWKDCIDAAKNLKAWLLLKPRRSLLQTLGKTTRSGP